MKKYNLLLSFVFILLISIELSSAFFPVTHQYISSYANNISVDSNLLSACNKYPELCASGDALDDVSVLFYYSSYKRYLVTHSPSFCRSLLENANSDAEQSCAVGGCIHQSQDLPSHTIMVPYSITHTLLPNGFIHPFSEQHLDNIIQREHPELKAKEITSLNSYDQCVPLFKRVLQGESAFNGVDLDNMFAKFVAEVQGSNTGYDASFSNITSIPFMVMFIFVLIMVILALLIFLFAFKFLRTKIRFLFWINLIVMIFFIIIFGVMLALFIGNLGGKAFATFQFIIKPVSNLVPIGDYHSVLDQAITNTRNLYMQGESSLFNTDASGYQELKSADNSILLPQIAIILLLLSLIGGLIYLNFWLIKNRK